MPYDQSEVSSLKSALAPRASAVADSLGGSRTDQVVALLNSVLRVQPSASLTPLIDAVQKPENFDGIQAAERFWEQFPDPAPAPPTAGNSTPASTQTATNASAAGAGNVALQTPPPSTQNNNTTIWLAYITTFGFFFLVLCLIGFDRFPSVFAALKNVGASGAVPAPAPAAAPGTGATDLATAPYRDILMTLMGVIGTAWAGIISFYFGSSVGSRAQSETLQDISRGAVRPSSGN